MKPDGHQLLSEFAQHSANTFEAKFSNRASSLALGSFLTRSEVKLLYRAAFRAALCNIAFNGLGGCNGVIKPEREPHRRKLERFFLAARDRFMASAGYQALESSTKASVQQMFLTVAIQEKSLTPA